MPDFYILAKNNRQALAYCKAKGIKPDRRRIINTTSTLKRLEMGQKIKLVGNYYMRPDFSYFEKILVAREWKIYYDTF